MYSENFLYVYKALVTKVYDGDTITCDIDLGLNVWLKDQKIRLAGIDAPELRGEEREEGLRVRDLLREKILDKEVTLKTYKDKTGKYGRWIADVYLGDVFVNAWLVLSDNADIYMK
jgi:micrococcal nuclease